jgi:outer membrane protein assembly factor BamA
MTKRCLRFAFLCSALSAPQLLLAQRAEPTAASDSNAPSGSTIVPLPVAFYMPETKFGFGLAASYYMYGHEQRADRVLPSSIGFLGIYTTEKQIIMSGVTDLYLRGGQVRLLGNMGYSKFPTKYWGIGNETPDTLEEDYTPKTFLLGSEIQWQVREGWYVGAVAQFASRTLAEVADSGLLAAGDAPGANDGHLVGLGALLTRDSRNNTVYPTQGSYHQLRAVVHDGLIGSDWEFALLTADLRTYVPLAARQVLALRALGEWTTGAPPFDLLPQLGGDVLLRGYYQGRFRDRHLIAVEAEYRAPLWWRIGVVGFAGAGQVAGTLDNFRFDRFKASVGGGLRFLLDPKAGLNIRADYGWAFDVGTGGFYLNIGEAF